MRTSTLGLNFRIITLAGLLVYCLVSAASVAATERVVVPTPPGGGPGIATAPADEAPPYTGSGEFQLTGYAEHRMSDRLADRFTRDATRDKSLRYDDIGGDDIVVTTDEEIWYNSMDIATNGDIYVAVTVDDPTTGWEIQVHRSLDGGESWTLWGLLQDSDPDVTYTSPCIHVAEGTADRCFVAFLYDEAGITFQIRVAGSDLALTSGDFSTEVVAMSDPAANFYSPDLTSDSVSFDGYFLYLVAQHQESDGGDIFFTRSIDYGVSFESAYAIASLTVGDRDYFHPDVAYGFDGYVHVAWAFGSRTEAFDDALRYRRATSYAGGGLGSWTGVQYLTSTTNGVNEMFPQMAASATDDQVVIAHERRYGISWGDPGVFGSDDYGATFAHQDTIPNGIKQIASLEKQAATGNWILGGYHVQGDGLQRASSADITSWSSVETFEDRSHYTSFSHSTGMAIDPSHDDQVAMIWSMRNLTATPDTLMFDAEWRSGPGYPNLEDGFPQNLVASPKSPPAVVDLDGDDDLEIVFSDQDNMIQVFHHDGSVMSGWPVAVPATLSDGPVAIGDMRGNGGPLLIVGTTNGYAYAYESDGTAIPGWPFNTTTGATAYVSIGALGGMYPRLAAVAAGERLYFLNDDGIIYNGFYRSWPGRTFSAPVAIGDVDGDGVAEAVGAVSERVFAAHAEEATGVFFRDVPSDVSDAVTLGDFDLDGDVEVVVPTEDGSLYLLQGDGSDFAGTWPFVSSTGSRLSSAAIADCLGTGEPEIAVAAFEWTVHLLYHTGSQQPGYPVETASWFIHGAPVMGYLDDYHSSDVIIGARGYRGWGWDNFGYLVPGWPKWFDDHVYQPPALGDLDLDGSTEIVFLSLGQLIIVDVNQVVTPARQSWPMYGYDPQRTGCADCDEDITTAVDSGSDEESGGIEATRVSFAAPSPNPLAGGGTTFSFALPGRAQVRLEVYDIRGRRVATVTREEATAGPHLIAWEGRDDTGRPLASGQYLARLTARGPGIDKTLLRKLTVLR